MTEGPGPADEFQSHLENQATGSNPPPSQMPQDPMPPAGGGVSVI